MGFKGNSDNNFDDLDELDMQEAPWQRDDFAMLAMQSLLGAHTARVMQFYPAPLWASETKNCFADVAKNAYAMADAMLKAREVGQ